MTDPTVDFFEELGRRGHEPLLAKATGSIRVDLSHNGETDRWLVEVDKGDITVSQKSGAADLEIAAEKAFFDRVAAGEVNATAAYLRGALTGQGDWELLVLFQRLLPGPPRQRRKRRARGTGTRKR
jgi:putative sterol carrier protein